MASLRMPGSRGAGTQISGTYQLYSSSYIIMRRYRHQTGTLVYVCIDGCVQSNERVHTWRGSSVSLVDTKLSYSSSSSSSISVTAVENQNKSASQEVCPIAFLGRSVGGCNVGSDSSSGPVGACARSCSASSNSARVDSVAVGSVVDRVVGINGGGEVKGT